VVFLAPDNAQGKPSAAICDECVMEMVDVLVDAGAKPGPRRIEKGRLVA
jgi:hypothetical protein